jgi:tetratricopeptide (TPR) repeat protein
MTRCPSREQLQQLLEQRLDPAEQTLLEAHIEHCASCQSSLEALTSAADWLALVPVSAGQSEGPPSPPETILTRKPRTTPTLSKPTAGPAARGRRRGPRAGQLLGAVVALLLAGLLLWYIQRLQAEREAALHSKERAEADARRAFAVAEVLFDRVMNDTQALDAAPSESLVPVRAVYAELFAEEHDNPALQLEVGQALYRLGIISRALETPSQSLEFFQRAVAVFTTLLASDPEFPAYRAGLARSSAALGVVLQELGREEQAETTLLRAVTLWPAQPYTDDSARHLANTCRHLGVLSRRVGKVEQARRYLEQALGLLSDPTRASSSAAWQEELARTWADLGDLHRETGHLQEALAAFSHAQEICQKGLRQQPSSELWQRALADCEERLALLYLDLNRPTEAEEAARQAVQLLEPLAQAHRAELARSYDTMGLVNLELGRLDQAEPLFQKALEGWERLEREGPFVPEVSYHLACVRNHLGSVYRQSQRLALAVALHDQSLSLCERLVQDHPAIVDYTRQLVATLQNLGEASAEQGHLDQAETFFRRAVTLSSQLVKNHEFDIPSLGEDLGTLDFHLGRLLLRQGQAAAARDFFAHALRRLPPMHAGNRLRNQVFEAHCSRAEAWMQLRHPAEALIDWECALALDDGSRRNWLRARRASSLASLGQYADAADEARSLLSEPSASTSVVYLAAGVCAQAIAAALREDRPAEDREKAAKEYAALSLEGLNRARARGYFQDQAALDRLLKDPDFAPLRQRPEFSKLMTEWQAGQK